MARSAPNEICAMRAARLLGVHINTLYRWAAAALAGEPSRLSRVRQDLTGHYWLDRDEIERLREEMPSVMRYT